MRDSYVTDDLRSDLMEDETRLPLPGMRHSIRPRRVVATRPAAATSAEVIEATPDHEPLSPYQNAYVPQADLPRWHELATVEAGSRRKQRAPPCPSWIRIGTAHLYAPSICCARACVKPRKSMAG